MSSGSAKSFSSVLESDSNGGVVTTCCPGVVLPTALHAEIHVIDPGVLHGNGRPLCNCLDGVAFEVPLHTSSPPNFFSWRRNLQELLLCSDPFNVAGIFEISCDGGAWGGSSGIGEGSIVEASCDPFEIRMRVENINFRLCGGGAGIVDIIVTL